MVVIKGHFAKIAHGIARLSPIQSRQRPLRLPRQEEFRVAGDELAKDRLRPRVGDGFEELDGSGVASKPGALVRANTWLSKWLFRLLDR
jgi:hypothetical protein